MERIPSVDFAGLHDPIREDLHRAAIRLIDSGNYIGGPEVRDFESEMARWLGVPEVCGVSCATFGLFSILSSMGVGAGDEVVVPAHTAIATAEAVSLTGARVVFADIEPGTFSISPRSVEQKLSARTRAIIPVHLYGQPADLDAILGLAGPRGIRVIEDCAQSQGARYRGRPVGTWADAAVFSFFPSKNLGGFGDGGAVTARDPELLKTVRMFSNHGRETKYDHKFEGINSRLDALQAALLRVCLPCLDEWNRHRREAAEWYADMLQAIPEVTLPLVRPQTDPVYHLYVVIVPDRDALRQFLAKEGIETGVHYPCSLNLLSAYADRGELRGSYPEAEYACDHVLSLPMHPTITRSQVERVCQTTRRFFQK